MTKHEAEARELLFFLSDGGGKDEAVEAIAAKLAALEADRDEWKTQHDNAVACWYKERDRLATKLSASEAERDALRREGAWSNTVVAVLRERDEARSQLAAKLEEAAQIAEAGHNPPATAKRIRALKSEPSR